MAGFLYYAPGQNAAITHHDIARWGLAYAFDKPPAGGVMRGPDGNAGMLFCDDSRPGAPAIGYSPKTQTWRKVAKTEVTPVAQVWVGMSTDEPPTPSFLARPRQVSGHEVELADGNPWLIPCARQFAEVNGEPAWHSPLPRYLDFDERGKVVEGDILAEYRALWDIAEGFANDISRTIGKTEDDQDVIVDMQSYAENAVAAIRTNYYVSVTELGLLHALTKELVSDVMLAVIDWATFIDLLEKKKLASGIASDPGNSGIDAAIGQRLAS